MLTVFAMRQELSEPSWENPTTIEALSAAGSCFPAHPDRINSISNANASAIPFRIDGPPGYQIIMIGE